MDMTPQNNPMGRIDPGPLNHITRLTNRLEESIRFYRDVVGFEEVRRPNFPFAGAWLFRNGLQIHLIVDSELPEPKGPINSRLEHIAFQSDDLEGVERVLRTHGIAYRVNLQAGTGIKQIFCRDPDGAHIEFADYRT